MKLLFAIATAMACLSQATHAVERTQAVKFAPGKTATNIKGTVTGYDGMTYSIETAAGQTMQILFAPSNRSCYVNVYEPTSKETAIHVGSLKGNEFGANPTAEGSYTIRAYLMRNAARREEICRYTLSVEITGKPGGVSPGVSNQLMVDVCIANAAQMYGVQRRLVNLSSPIASTKDGGFTIDGTVDKGAEGIKKLRCIYRPDRQFSHIQAMTSDGE